MKIIPLNMEKYLNKSPMVVFIWNTEPNAPVHFVSKNIEQFGYTQEEFLENKLIFSDIVHPDDYPRIRNESQTNIKNGIHNFTQNYRIITKSGEIRNVEDKTWLELDQDGNFLHYCGLVYEKEKIIPQISKTDELHLYNEFRSIIKDYILKNKPINDIKDGNIKKIQKKLVDAVIKTFKK